MTDAELRALLSRALEHAARYRAAAPDRPHRPLASYEEMRARFAAPVPETGAAPAAVIEELAALAAPGLAAMTGPRFFGWVIGATEPAGLAADWLTSAWAQNAGNHRAAPAAAAAEETAAGWLLDLLDLPRQSSVGFATGATVANFVCLAAARGEVLRRAGWDVEAQGLFAAPPITVVLGEEAHSTIFTGLRYLGLGAERVVRVPADREGRAEPSAFAAALKAARGPVIAIAQAGHINSGGFDAFAPLADAAEAAGAWLHVDGAFGLWARACPELAHLAAGVERAQSWGVDGHKWLQTPHDCGYAIVADRAAHERAMSNHASYLPGQGDGGRNPGDLVPELSRRARGFATWAMIKALGREGIAAMVARHGALARRLAARLAQSPDIGVMHEVVLNQVAFRLGTDLAPGRADALTRATVPVIQEDGTCFMGGAEWKGRAVIRASVIGAQTSEDDIDRSADAVLAAWRRVKAEAGARA